MWTQLVVSQLSSCLNHCIFVVVFSWYSSLQVPHHAFKDCLDVRTESKFVSRVLFCFSILHYFSFPFSCRSITACSRVFLQPTYACSDSGLKCQAEKMLQTLVACFLAEKNSCSCEKKKFCLNLQVTFQLSIAESLSLWIPCLSGIFLLWIQCYIWRTLPTLAVAAGSERMVFIQ